MECSIPGLPVPHQLPELTQTHVHWVGDATQPSHPLSSSSPPALNLSQHQGLFKWVSSLQKSGQSIGVSASASVLQMNTRDWSPSGWTGWISLQSKGLSRVFSNTTVQKHPFFCAQVSLWSHSHIHTLGKPQPWPDGPLSAKWCDRTWQHPVDSSCCRGHFVILAPPPRLPSNLWVKTFRFYRLLWGHHLSVLLRASGVLSTLHFCLLS